MAMAAQEGFVQSPDGGSIPRLWDGRAPIAHVGQSSGNMSDNCPAYLRGPKVDDLQAC